MYVARGPVSLERQCGRWVSRPNTFLPGTTGHCVWAHVCARMLALRLDFGRAWACTFEGTHWPKKVSISNSIATPCLSHLRTVSTAVVVGQTWAASGEIDDEQQKKMQGTTAVRSYRYRPTGSNAEIIRKAETKDTTTAALVGGGYSLPCTGGGEEEEKERGGKGGGGGGVVLQTSLRGLANGVIWYNRTVALTLYCTVTYPGRANLKRTKGKGRAATPFVCPLDCCTCSM